MNKLLKTITMINTEDGHNKVWVADLYDDKTVITRWGKRTATALQSKTFPNAEHHFTMIRLRKRRRKAIG